MGYLAEGEKQVTIAGFQKDKNGQAEFVITDLNPVVAREKDYPLAYERYVTGDSGNSAVITKSRKNRAKRFAGIRNDFLAKAKLKGSFETKTEKRRNEMLKRNNKGKAGSKNG